MLRFLLIVVLIFLLIRAVIRFLASRFLAQKWPFQTLNRNDAGAASASGVVEETDFEVIETKISDTGNSKA